MTNTITDPQDQALMQQVVEAANECQSVVGMPASVGTPWRQLIEATIALRDYRAKSSSPEPARCEPPEGTPPNTFHWLSNANRIEPFYWSDLCLWKFTGSSANWTRDEITSAGWRYHSPARPCLPDTRPSDTEVEQSEPPWLRDMSEGNRDCLAKALPGEPMFIILGRDWAAGSAIDAWCAARADHIQTGLLLDTPEEREHIAAVKKIGMEMRLWFKGHPGASRSYSAGKSEVAEQVHPTDTRIQPTDEAIRSFMASNWGVDDEEAIYLVNAALAHFSPTQTITPDQLKALYSLSKTRAPEQFIIDAKRVLRGEG